MEIRKSEEGRKIVVEPVGRIDTFSAPEFSEEVMKVITDADELVIDLSKVIYVSSAGLRAFANVDKEMVKKGGKLVVRDANDAVTEVFNITGFGAVIDIQ